MNRSTVTYSIADINSFKQKLIQWASQFDYYSVLKGNIDQNSGLYLEKEFLVGADSLSVLETHKNSFEQLENFYDQQKDWLFGALSYDLKNELEKLESNNLDSIFFPKLIFFQPKWVFEINGNDVSFHYPNFVERSQMRIVFKQIMKSSYINDSIKKIKLKQRTSKNEYIDNFKKIKDHINKGDIYEINYCQEFYCEDVNVNMLQVFKELDKISDAPFSAFFKAKKIELACASPERFLKKSNKKLISQPIKGTKKRGKDSQQDELFKNNLLNCTKERSENVMIVDLVRNDLSKTATEASVIVEELFGVYTFKQVHQMISTITSTLKSDKKWSQALKDCFPMGSMTGAPKIKAMELIEKYENAQRGLYSGSVGYITPDLDFDFNVVIRSVLYNSQNKYLSFSVGGAITAQSIADKEYEECLLKANAIFNVLNA